MRSARWPILLLVLGLFAAAACGAETNPPDPDRGTPTPEPSVTEDIVVGPHALLIGVDSVGGTDDELIDQMAQMWSGHFTDIGVTPDQTGGVVEKMFALNAGRIDLAVTSNDTAVQAAFGEGDFEGNALDFAYAGALYPSVLHIVAREGSGIESLADLEGARVEIGGDGSTTHRLAEQVLQAAGVEPEETTGNGFGDGVWRMGNDDVDAAFGLVTPGDEALTNLLQDVDARLVTIPDGIRAELERGGTALHRRDIPGGTYRGNDEDAATVAYWTSLYVASELDENLVYVLVQALYENAEGIDHPLAVFIDVAVAAEGAAGVAVHPGAARYFAEMSAV